MNEIGGVVKIEYWAIQEGERLLDFEGVDEFRNALAKEYLTQIHARPGDLGGLYGLTVEFLTTFSLQHFVTLILDGIAYDLIRSGADALVLKPFIAAYNTLKERNKGDVPKVSLDRLLLSFQDSLVIVHNVRDDSLVTNLEKILRKLAENYERLTLQNGERPFSIVIPLVEDPAEDRLIRFRELLDYDETIKEEIRDEQYLSLWGVQYDYARTTRVYDVKRQLLLDEKFYTQEQYWQEYDSRHKLK